MATQMILQSSVLRRPIGSTLKRSLVTVRTGAGGIQSKDCMQQWTSTSSATTSTRHLSLSTSTPEEQKLAKQELKKERRILLEEAAVLTRSLYRLCIRSARTIQLGNDHDEAEFQAREKQRLEPRKKDVRLSMLSMLPPVDRADELRSRAEYYMQYTRENFVQESDCLSMPDAWQEQHIARYLFHLKRGDEHRKWLLTDMRFDDKYEIGLDHDKIDKFEERALAHVQKIADQLEASLRPEVRKQLQEEREAQAAARLVNSDDMDDASNEDDDDDGFFDEDEDDDDSPPEWFTRNHNRS